MMNPAELNFKERKLFMGSHYRHTVPAVDRLKRATDEYARLSSLKDPDPEIQEAYDNRLMVLSRLITRLENS